MVGSIFDYSFFARASTCLTNVKLVERIQNRAIRSMHKLSWDSPTVELFGISKILPLRSRFDQLAARHMYKAIRNRNQLINPLVSECAESYSAIKKKDSKGDYILSTPLCFSFCIIGLAALSDLFRRNPCDHSLD